jgi:hypothetical protein
MWISFKKVILHETCEWFYKPYWSSSMSPFYKFSCNFCRKPHWLFGHCPVWKMKRWTVCIEVISVITLLVSHTPTNAYSQGAGAQACSSLTPWHSANQPQTIPVPYVITVSKTSYRPLEQIVGKFNTSFGIIQNLNPTIM